MAKKYKFQRNDLVVIISDNADIPKGTICYIADIDEKDDEYPYLIVKEGIELLPLVTNIDDWEWVNEKEIKPY